jgi:hypothetical protein
MEAVPEGGEVMEEEKTIIRRRLKGTPFLVAVELDMVQYQHFLVAEGRWPTVSMPMDVNVMREMVVLRAHFVTQTWQDVTDLIEFVEDEARDAAEIVGGM